MHECFHRVQESIGLPATDAINNLLYTMTGRIWLQLEWRAIERALRTQGLERKQAIADALYFRSYRRQLIPNAAEADNAIESNEGVAEYTGVKSTSDFPAEAAVISAIDLRQAYRRQIFVRSFAYVSGPAYGFLLERATWRKGLEGCFHFGDLVAAAYSIPASVPIEAEAGARRYRGDEIIALETKRESDASANLPRRASASSMARF